MQEARHDERDWNPRPEIQGTGEVGRHGYGLNLALDATRMQSTPSELWMVRRSAGSMVVEREGRSLDSEAGRAARI
jgi:hypothetical protein